MAKTSKIAAVLLIVAFLASMIGSAFGFALCDHGVLSKTHLYNHHKGEHFDLYDQGAHPDQPSSLSEKKDNCQDLTLHAKEGILERSETIEIPHFTLDDSPHFSTFDLTEDRLSFSRLQYRENPKIPLSILSLRTTILLI